MNTLTRLKVLYWYITGVQRDKVVYWTGTGWSAGNALLDAQTYRHKRSAVRKAARLAYSARTVEHIKVASLATASDTGVSSDV